MRTILLTLATFITLLSSAQHSPEEIKKWKIKKRTQTNGEFSIYYTYDQQGNEVGYYSNDILYKRSVHTYKNGKLQLTVTYNGEGKLRDSTTYVYKHDGSSIAKNTDADFGLTEYIHYDKLGRKTKNIIPDGSERIYTYDTKGKLKRVLTKPMEGATIVDVTYTYDDKGRLIKEVSNGEYKWMNEYTYDSKGLLKSQKNRTSIDGVYGEESVVVYTYEFWE
jgi:hypothetical protein